MYTIVKTKFIVVDGFSVWVKDPTNKSAISADLIQGAQICYSLNENAPDDICYHLEQF